MSQKSLSNRLKAVIIGIGLCGVAFFAALVPWLCRELISAEGAAYPVVLCLIWVTALPCYTVLAFAWKIAANIGRDRSFSEENAVLLRRISTIASLTSVYVFGFVAGLLIAQLADLLVVLFAVVIIFIGVAIAIAAAALSHLVMKAAELQRESDLTI